MEPLECQGEPGDFVLTSFLGNIFFFTFSDAVTRETHRFAKPSSLLARSRNGISARGCLVPFRTILIHVPVRRQFTNARYECGSRPRQYDYQFP